MCKSVTAVALLWCGIYYDLHIENIEEIKMSSWISVDEKLPNLEEEVLCFFDFGVHSVMKFKSNGRFKHSMQKHDSWSESVTHWMPLPDAPEETK